MAGTVTIGGVAVSVDDPCAIASALKLVRLSVVTGSSVSMTRFDQDEVRFVPTNIAALDAEIARYENECSMLTGTRRRGARIARWR